LRPCAPLRDLLQFSSGAWWLLPPMHGNQLSPDAMRVAGSSWRMWVPPVVALTS
jgi:hypothetical protein